MKREKNVIRVSELFRQNTDSRKIKIPCEAEKIAYGQDLYQFEPGSKCPSTD